VVIIKSVIEVTELQKAVHTYGIPAVFTSWLVSGISDKKIKSMINAVGKKTHIE